MPDNVFLNAERLVRTALALLERDSVLASMVWRDPAGDFRGAKNDTITIRLPAYTKANSRALRSGDARTVTVLNERKVDVTLDTDVYQRVQITDEQLTLDIEDFEAQVIVPVAASILRGIEDGIVALAQNATYANTVAMNYSDTFPAVTKARRYLNDSRVPFDGRVLVVGSGMEEALLEDPQFVRYQNAGSTDAFREARIGRVAGFDVVTVPALDPDAGFAFHKTAYALSSRAPFIPASAPAGATLAGNGFALRIVQILEPDTIVDNLHADVWTGMNVVKDFGSIDSNGYFTPGEDPNNPAAGEDELFVRAVQLTKAA